MGKSLKKILKDETGLQWDNIAILAVFLTVTTIV
jgi:hypothetical protein